MENDACLPDMLTHDQNVKVGTVNSFSLQFLVFEIHGGEQSYSKHEGLIGKTLNVMLIC